MQHWAIHFIFRIAIICVIFFVFLAIFSGDGSGDAMGNGLESAFSLVVAFTIILIGAVVFLGREYVRLSREKAYAKAACNIVIIISLLLVPIIVLSIG